MGTYAGKDWSGRAKVPGREQTIGGYTSIMVPGLDDMTFFFFCLVVCLFWRKVGHFVVFTCPP